MRGIFFQGFLTNILEPQGCAVFSGVLPQFVSSDAPSKPLVFLFLGAIFDFTARLDLLVAWSTARISSRLGTSDQFQNLVQSVRRQLFVFVGIRLALAAITSGATMASIPADVSIPRWLLQRSRPNSIAPVVLGIFRVLMLRPGHVERPVKRCSYYRLVLLLVLCWPLGDPGHRSLALVWLLSLPFRLVRITSTPCSRCWRAILFLPCTAIRIPRQFHGSSFVTC